MTNDPSEKPRDSIAELAELLDEAKVELYFNPFADSKNSADFAKYHKKIRDLQLAYQSAIERVKELREAVTALQVELNSLRTVNEILQSERLAKTKESP